MFIRLGVLALIGVSALVQFVLKPQLTHSNNQAAPATSAAPAHQTVKPASNLRWVTATDRTCRIAIPKSWAKMELNDAADVEFGSTDLHQYLIVVTDNKADLAVNLTKFAHDGVASLTRGLQSKQVSAARQLQVGGRPALQYEIHGIVGSSRIVYWHTSVEGVSHFYQVITWTGASHLAEAGPTLRNAATMLREITA